MCVRFPTAVATMYVCSAWEVCVLKIKVLFLTLAIYSMCVEIVLEGCFEFVLSTM